MFGSTRVPQRFVDLVPQAELFPARELALIDSLTTPVQVPEGRELMRQGASPQEACMQAVERIAKKLPDYKNFQVGFLALNKQGEYGAYCIQPGFNYAVKSSSTNDLFDGKSIL